MLEGQAEACRCHLQGRASPSPGLSSKTSVVAAWATQEDSRKHSSTDAIILTSAFMAAPGPACPRYKGRQVAATILALENVS